MLLDGVGGRRRCGAFIAALVVAACALVLAPAAMAEQIVVNSITDKADAIPGVACLPAGEECTLRAAIETANSSEGEDEIVFDEAIFNGGIGGTIALSSNLPAIADPVFISADCIPSGGALRPCVGINGPNASAPAVTVNNADFTTIEGIAVTGAQTGIRVESSEVFKIAGSWLGVKLDGSAGGNVTGVFFDPESNEGRVGGELPGAGNVFANNTAEGLDILGADNVRVLGNYFGVKPDGATQAANGKDVEVTSTEEFEATGTAIGTRVTFESSATTPECDGGCNLISGATSTGIDLEGDGGAETPAAATTVLGNYIGLNAAGTAAVPNAVSGIRVGKAGQTVIGGPKVGEANRINGGGTAVLAGPAAEDLVIRGNRIGAEVSGAGTLAPPDDGIVVNSQEFTSPAFEALIAGNVIRMEGGVAISQQGFGARISGNEISGPETGIRTFKFSGEHGNLIEGNSIEEAEINGLLIENGLNEILGNAISAAGGAGIRILGANFSVTENLVGGDAAVNENVVSGSGGDAIEIVDVEETENEVARNRGIGNDGLFIDLVAAGAEPKGPNSGIEPPTFLTSTQAIASGDGAEPGANVRVFRKQSGEAGELASFLGSAVADAGGSWKVTYAGAVPPGTIVAATQTSEAGGTSELRTATTSGQPSGGGSNPGGVGSSGADNPVDGTSPKTKIVKASKRNSRGSVMRFTFSADEAAVTFQCKLDSKPFRACKSPKIYGDLNPGKHVFKVRAIDPAGNVDSSPAKRKFTVRQ